MSHEDLQRLGIEPEDPVSEWREIRRLEAVLKTIASKLGIEKEDLPGQLPAQIIDAIDKLQTPPLTSHQEELYRQT